MSKLGKSIALAILPFAGAAGVCLVTGCEPPATEPRRQFPQEEENQQRQEEEPQPIQPEQEEQEQSW